MNKNIAVNTQHEVTVDAFNYTNAELDFSALPNGWRAYKLIDLAQNGGSLISQGSFSQVKIWMPPTVVHYSPAPTAKTTLPGPNPLTAPSPTFTYPAAPQFDLVVTQCLSGIPDPGANEMVTYTPMLATATSEKDCQTIPLNNSIKNIFIAFNDLVNAYGDNTGKVSVMVKLID